MNKDEAIHMVRIFMCKECIEKTNNYPSHDIPIDIRFGAVGRTCKHLNAQDVNRAKSNLIIEGIGYHGV